MSKIAEKIRALLDKAESTDFEEERDTFLAAAANLMVKYDIDRATVDSAGQKVDRGPIGYRTLYGQSSGPYALARNAVATAAAEGAGCRSWKSGKDVQFFGYEDQLDNAEALYTSLLLQATTAAARSYDKRIHGHKTRYTRSFLFGFAQTVYARIRDAKKAAVAEVEDSSPGSSLVLLDTAQAIEDAMRSEGIRLSRTSATALDRAGRDSGSAAGRNADIGNGRLGARHALTA